mmetsp:Transcript_168477/g.298606  ORF Transcript_168477/g.298606 Transcript_168477/m.298606 type:complete len:337 (+) Transcript_168477:214-1224(+)
MTHQTPLSCLSATEQSLSFPFRFPKPFALCTWGSLLAARALKEITGTSISCGLPSTCKTRFSSVALKIILAEIFLPSSRFKKTTGRPPPFVASRTKSAQLFFMYSLACSHSSISKGRVATRSSSLSFNWPIVLSSHSASWAFLSIFSTEGISVAALDSMNSVTSCICCSRLCCFLWSSSCFSACVITVVSRLSFLAVVIASFIAMVLPLLRLAPAPFKVSITSCLYLSSPSTSSSEDATTSDPSSSPLSLPVNSSCSGSFMPPLPASPFFPFSTSEHFPHTPPILVQLCPFGKPTACLLRIRLHRSLGSTLPPTTTALATRRRHWPRASGAVERPC